MTRLEIVGRLAGLKMEMACNEPHDALGRRHLKWLVKAVETLLASGNESAKA